VPSEFARRGAARRPGVARGPRTVLLATPGESEERRIQAATGRLFFGYFLFDCKDAGGRAMQEQLPRRRKRKYLAFGGETPIQASVAAATP
jgi:hypothetical protein